MPRIQGPQPPDDGVEDVDPAARVPARIGQLYFKYSDPSVDVVAEANTVEHETINDTIVVQTMGRKADQVTINAIVSDIETELLDFLVATGPISLRSSRWSGTVIVQSVDTTFRREKDKDDEWLYDATITCLEAG